MSATGYSGTPLAKKLGYKPGFVAHLKNTPNDYANIVDPLPDDVTFADNADGANLVHFFTTHCTSWSSAYFADRYRY